MVVGGKARPLRSLVLAGGLALSLILAGCIEIAIESEFESDGSARHSMSMLIDRSLADDPMFAGEFDFEEMEREARAAGFDAEPVETDQQVGIRMSRDVTNNEDLGEVLNVLFSSVDAESPETDAFAGSFSTTEGGIGRKTTHTLTITLNADELFGEEAEEMDDFGLPPEMMRQFINLTYTARLPGEVVEHNGVAVGDNGVRWDLPFEGTQTFQATSEEEGGISMLFVAGAGLGALAILMVAIGGVLIMSQRRRAVVPSESTLAPPMDDLPPPPPRA
jgi:hypothetical protein